MSGQVEVPVLILLVLRTRLFRWFTDSSQLVALYVANAHIRKLPELGHFAPLVAPQPVAGEITRFFNRN